MKRQQTFEPKIANQINDFFTATEQLGKAIRLRQAHFGEYQDVDILVLSSQSRYRMAIECKSVLEPSSDKIYFSSHFTIDKQKEHQVSRITKFCVDSGLYGVLAVELRSGVSRRANEVHLIPWRIINKLFLDGEKGISYDIVREWPRFKRVNGVMNLDQCIEEMRYTIPPT